ncbi:hypothetical protein CC80DRAFT_140879 [Byssothecium circinans]|uniref:Fungal N-terminal domain-containing protein n=1 Tax=Byssothecium circinans TaxID=147558 RepID=A0A6A5TP71_9PLEO|nr:hypothetical protein CC80DRAFT_140879 [Byssothecium circinans]
MAEAIGLAASILTLTSASFKVAQSLYNIADSIGMAGLEFRACAEEISGFSRLLERVHELLKLISGISPEDMSLLKDVFDIFHRVLKEFQWLQDTLAPLLVKYQDSPGKLRQLGLRICWTLSWKNLLHFYRDIVRAQHRNLDTALSIINLLSSKDRTPQFIKWVKHLTKSDFRANST